MSPRCRRISSSSTRLLVPERRSLLRAKRIVQASVDLSLGSGDGDGTTVCEWLRARTAMRAMGRNRHKHPWSEKASLALANRHAPAGVAVNSTTIGSEYSFTSYIVSDHFASARSRSASRSSRCVAACARAIRRGESRPPGVFYTTCPSCEVMLMTNGLRRY